MKKVLIVDDEQDLLDSLRDLFEEEGYTVATAANGAEALALLKAGEPPSVMILDLIMPLVSGEEVYAKMQGDPELAKVPVVVSTSDPARAPSGVLVMKKPINLERLLRAVQQHCA